MSKQDAFLRKGKWTQEEENYANLIISLFNQGRLPILAGTTLRSYLSEKLRCDPMRITKKYAGTSSIGKQVYQPSEEYMDNPDQFKENELELNRMERIFLKRVNSKNWNEEELSPASTSAKRAHSTRSLRTREKSVDFTDYYTGDFEEMTEQGSEQPQASSSSSNSRRRGLRNSAEAALQTKPSSNTSAAFLAPNNRLARFKDEGHHASVIMLNAFSSRRFFSAPNLLALDPSFYSSSQPFAAADDSNQFGKGIYSSAFYSRHRHLVQENSAEAEDFTNLPNRLFPFSGSSNNNSTSSNRGLRKRSHSVMALMDFEKLVDDDEAADDLFLEFVTQMREKTQRKKVKAEEPISAVIQEEAASGTDTTDHSASEQTKGTPSTIVPSAAHDTLPPSTDIHQGQFNPMKDVDGTEDQDNFF
jgi:hypothetical protein